MRSFSIRNAVKVNRACRCQRAPRPAHFRYLPAVNRIHAPLAINRVISPRPCVKQAQVFTALKVHEFVVGLRVIAERHRLQCFAILDHNVGFVWVQEYRTAAIARNKPA